MADPKVVGFDSRAAFERMNDAVLKVEAEGRRDRVPKHDLQLPPPGTVVKVTGVVDAGYYPGVVSVRACDGTVVDAEQCRLRVMNPGELLGYGIRYPGFLSDEVKDGFAVYEVLGELEAEFVYVESFKIDDSVTPCQIVPLTYKKVKERATRLTVFVEPYTPP